MSIHVYRNVTVEDTGVGMHNYLLDQIFSPGFSTKNPADKSNKMDLPHLGMGLWSVKDCIDKHNGLINVESKVGAGTIFKIKLPVLDS